jgi:hypothetical protein
LTRVGFQDARTRHLREYATRIVCCTLTSAHRRVSVSPKIYTIYAVGITGVGPRSLSKGRWFQLRGVRPGERSSHVQHRSPADLTSRTNVVGWR